MSFEVVVALSALYQRGGIQRFNRLLCLALDRLAPEIGLRCTVFSQHDDDEDHRRLGRPFSHLEFVGGRGKLRLSAAALSFCARRRPDLMLVGLLGMAPLGLICRPFLRHGYGFVAHGYECWSGPPAPAPPLSRRLAARRARFAFAVSRHTRDALIDSTGMQPDSVSLLPNTLDPVFEQLPSSSPDAAGDGHTELLTVARLSAADPLKGVDHTLRAFAEIARRRDRILLRIVGEGADKPRLVALARELRIDDRVVFEESLTDEQLAERYRGCALFVLPSGQEGFGIVFLEAMRFSKPCIGGRAGGTTDVIADGETGFLVPYGDEVELRTAMERLLDDPGLRDSMGRAGRSRLLAQFSFEAYRERLGGELRRLLTETGP